MVQQFCRPLLHTEILNQRNPKQCDQIWRNFMNLCQMFKGLFNVCQIVEPTLVKLLFWDSL